MSRSINSKYLIVIFSVLLCSNADGQGKVDGFYKGKGNLEFVLGGGVEGAGKYFAGNNRIDLGRMISNVNVFFAAGITDRFDINLSAPFVMISNVRSVQDGNIYLKFKLFEKELDKGQFSMTLAPGFSGNLSNYQTEGFAAIGQQAKTIDLRPVFHFMSNRGWFITGQASYLYRFDPVPSSVNGGVKAGYAAAKYYYDFWIEHQTSFGGYDYQGTPSPPSFRELNVGYTKIGGTFYMPIGQRFGFFSGLSFVLDGRNVGQGFGLNLGVVLKNLPANSN